MQIHEPELEVCLIVLPRQSVYAGRGVPLQLEERQPEKVDIDVAAAVYPSATEGPDRVAQHITAVQIV